MEKMQEKLSRILHTLSSVITAVTVIGIPVILAIEEISRRKARSLNAK